MTADSNNPTASVAASISNGIVGAMAAMLGRGPTKARAHISQDLIAVVLRDGMTRSETMLVEHGHVDQVLAGRRAIQQSMRSTLVGIVEDATGRKVDSFFSDNRTDPDIAVEIFLLDPINESGTSEAI